MSVLVLVMNGVSIGSVVGLYASKGILLLLVAFVAPHGVLELFAICVAGGAAFLIAAGMLLPGTRSRRRALVENGQRAIRLIGVSTLLLVVAGLLEGFVSPIPWWPIEGKLAVSGTTLVLLVSYLRGGRTTRQRRRVRRAVHPVRRRAERAGARARHSAPRALSSRYWLTTAAAIASGATSSTTTPASRMRCSAVARSAISSSAAALA